MQIQDFPLTKITYKRGWRLYLDPPTDDCPVYKLMIVSLTDDSYQPERQIRVRHEFMTPPADYLEHVWLAWIFDRIRDVEANHEAGEFFQYDGTRPFAPHHGNGQDPYRVWFVGSYAETRTRAGDDDAGRCNECDVTIADDDVNADWGMCGSCVHDAIRSGWEPDLTMRRP